MNNHDSIISRRMMIEGVVGIVMLVLAFFAIAASDVSASATHAFWTALVVLFAMVAFVVDRLYPDHRIGDPRRSISIGLHWLSVFIAIQLVYFFVSAGRMANADMGLSNGLILALGTFIGGVYGNWRLIVAGIALGLATAGVAFVEQYLWILSGIAVLAILALLFGSRLIRRIRNR